MHFKQRRRRQKFKRSRNFSVKPRLYSPGRDVIIPTGDQVAVVVSTSKIRSIYKVKQEIKERTCEFITAHSSSQRRTKIIEKKWYKCPECPVSCSREDYLLDHICRRHVMGNQPCCEYDEITEGTIASEIDGCSYSKVTCHMSGTAKDKTLGISIKDSRSDQSDIDRKCYRTVIQKGHHSSYCIQDDHGPANLKRLKLMLSGDVEENPGPTVIKCCWGLCNKGPYSSVSEFSLHVMIDHITSSETPCQWVDRVRPPFHNTDKLMSHVMQHIYRETFKFRNVAEWIQALPLAKFTASSTDLNICPPELRHQLGIPMFDEDFNIPECPYYLEHHMSSLPPHLKTVPIQTLVERVNYQATTSVSIGQSPQSRDTMQVTSQVDRNIQSIKLTTNRPELAGPIHQGSVKLLKFHDQARPKKRKHKDSLLVDESSEEDWKQQLISSLRSCQQAIDTEDKIITSLFSSKFLDQKNKQLNTFEEAAISLATYPDCTEGVFVYTIFKLDIDDYDSPVYYIRYLESGYFRTFMVDCFLKIFCEVTNVSQNNIFVSDICTQEDQLHLLQQKLNTKLKSERRPDKIYQHNLSKLVKARTELVNYSRNSDINLHSNFVHSIKYRFKANVVDEKSDKCYMQGDLDPIILDRVRESLNKYPENLPAVLPVSSSSDFLKEISAESTLMQKSIHINNLSNDQNKFLLKGQVLRYQRRFSTNKNATSLRNSILNCFKNSNIPLLYNRFRTAVISRLELSSTIIDSGINTVDAVTPKKPKITFKPRTKLVTKEMIQDSVGSISDTNIMRTQIYDSFKKNILGHNNSLFIQINNEDTLISIMNDYDDETGQFRPSDYVKTTRHLVEDGYYYTCSCKIYRTLLECLDTEGNDPLDALDMNGIKCMHCRFLKDEVVPNMIINERATASVLQHKVQQAAVWNGKSVIELPTVRSTTKKFSVFADDEQVSFVHLTLNTRSNRYVISCLNGYCKSKKGSKKNIISLQNESDLCVHLQELKKNPNLWEDLLRKDQQNQTFNDQDEIPEDGENADLNDRNNDLFPGSNEAECFGNFNVDDGMWCFPSESTHSAKSQGDPALSANIRKRNHSWIPSDVTDLDEGCAKGPDLCRDIPDFMCMCGSGWSGETAPNGKTIFDRTVTVYTMMAPVKCKIFTRVCLKEHNPCKLRWDEGQSLSLHVVTKETAAGDELGWQFVNQVMNSSTTFSSFCTSTTATYKMYNPNFRAFMDPSVFRKWWFSWASNMKIDFRKPCPVCKFTPKQLACDGTKVGIGFRHACFEDINKPDNPESVLPTVHRRMNRCFLHDNLPTGKENLKIAREHLNYLCLSVLSEIPANQVLSNEQLQNRNEILLTVLHEDVQVSFRRFLNQMRGDEKDTYSVVMKMLATTAPISSLIPNMYTEHLKALLDHLSGIRTHPNGNTFFNTKMKEMIEYAPEIRDLIATSMLNSENGDQLNNDILLLLYYLIRQVEDVAITDADPAIPQHGTYNPPKYGRAYYFSKTGERLRPIRKFTIDAGKKDNTAYDDPPAEHDKCEKYFSKTHVAARGTSTLFLWFCPNHGHCYGFHMTGAEGRKDPSASLYSHLETPPHDIFYDFACNLHEYCLNRENGYYKDVRFFHDIFHGFAHKCSCAYRSSRLLGFESINSEICEQFNSFIQCIKNSARQMTQEHFCFYLQFFLHQWNEKKRIKFEKRMTVALAGL